METAGPGTGGFRSLAASPGVQGAVTWPPFPATETLFSRGHGGLDQHYEQSYGTYGTMSVHSERDQALV